MTTPLHTILHTALNTAIQDEKAKIQTAKFLQYCKKYLIRTCFTSLNLQEKAGHKTYNIPIEIEHQDKTYILYIELRQHSYIESDITVKYIHENGQRYIIFGQEELELFEYLFNADSQDPSTWNPDLEQDGQLSISTATGGELSLAPQGGKLSLANTHTESKKKRWWNRK